MFFGGPDPALQLHDSDVLRIMVQLDSVHLFDELLQRVLLRPVISLQVHAHLALLIQTRVLLLHDIHLQHGAHGIFLRRCDTHLLAVVPQLGNHVIDHALEVIQVSTHGELLLLLIAT